MFSGLLSTFKSIFSFSFTSYPIKVEVIEKLNNKKICTCVVGISPLVILNKTPFKNIHSALLLIDTTDEI